MIVLVVNAGSSSLKCQLIDAERKQSLLHALFDGVGGPQSIMKVTVDASGQDLTIRKSTTGLDIRGCLSALLDFLASDERSPLHSLDEIDAIGNRVVSGGEYFTESTIVDDEVFARIDECSLIAPLHNPPAVACMDLLRRRLPSIPQAAVFDTAFHQTMPPKAYHYPIPKRYYDDYRIRRYGAHGTSHRYAAQRASDLLGRPLEDLGVITCHLGNGGSIAAVSGGRSIDTTMGFTPLEGLMMGTRSGSIDPAIVTYIMRRDGIGFDEMDRILNRDSGLLGVSGLSPDMRTLIEAADDGNADAKLAIDMYVYAVQKAIGSYYAIMTRTDAVVMTAGIGENSARLREMVFGGLAHMGMIIDRDKNDVVGQIGTNRIISVDDSPIAICVVTTDEEMRIARETSALLV